MSRFSDISRATELVAAKKAFDDWLALSPTAKQAAYKASTSKTSKRLRRGSENGYVRLFGSQNGFVQCKLLSSQNVGGDAATGENNTPLITLVTNAVIGGSGKFATIVKPVGAETTSVTVLSGSGFNLQSKLACVSLKQSKGAVEDRVSRFTKRPYKAKGSDTASCVFGAGDTSALESYAAVTAALKPILVPAGAAGEGLSVRFRPQGNISME